MADNDSVKKRLSQIVTKYDPSIFLEGERAKAIIFDYLGGHKYNEDRARFRTVYDQKIEVFLKKANEDKPSSNQVFQAALSKLVDNVKMQEATAYQTLDELFNVLGLVHKTQDECYGCHGFFKDSELNNHLCNNCNREGVTYRNETCAACGRKYHFSSLESRKPNVDKYCPECRSFISVKCSLCGKNEDIPKFSVKNNRLDSYLCESCQKQDNQITKEANELSCMLSDFETVNVYELTESLPKRIKHISDLIKASKNSTNNYYNELMKKLNELPNLANEQAELFGELQLIYLSKIEYQFNQESLEKRELEEKYWRTEVDRIQKDVKTQTLPLFRKCVLVINNRLSLLSRLLYFYQKVVVKKQEIVNASIEALREFPLDEWIKITLILPISEKDKEYWRNFLEQVALKIKLYNEVIKFGKLLFDNRTNNDDYLNKKRLEYYRQKVSSSIDLKNCGLILKLHEWSKKRDEIVVKIVKDGLNQYISDLNAFPSTSYDEKKISQIEQLAHQLQYPKLRELNSKIKQARRLEAKVCKKNKGLRSGSNSSNNSRTLESSVSKDWTKDNRKITGSLFESTLPSRVKSKSFLFNVLCSVIAVNLPCLLLFQPQLIPFVDPSFVVYVVALIFVSYFIYGIRTVYHFTSSMLLQILFMISLFFLQFYITQINNEDTIRHYVIICLLALSSGLFICIRLKRKLRVSFILSFFIVGFAVAIYFPRINIYLALEASKLSKDSFTLLISGFSIVLAYLYYFFTSEGKGVKTIVTILLIFLGLSVVNLLLPRSNFISLIIIEIKKYPKILMASLGTVSLICGVVNGFTLEARR